MARWEQKPLAGCPGLSEKGWLLDTRMEDCQVGVRQRARKGRRLLCGTGRREGGKEQVGIFTQAILVRNVSICHWREVKQPSQGEIFHSHTTGRENDSVKGVQLTMSVSNWGITAEHLPGVTRTVDEASGLAKKEEWSQHSSGTSLAEGKISMASRLPFRPL